MKSGAFLYVNDLRDFMSDEEPTMNGMIEHQMDITKLYKKNMAEAWKNGSKHLKDSNRLYDFCKNADKDGLSYDLILQLQIAAAEKSRKRSSDTGFKASSYYKKNVENESQFVDLVRGCYDPFSGSISAENYLFMIDAGRKAGISSKKIIEIEHGVMADEHIIDSFSV